MSIESKKINEAELEKVSGGKDMGAYLPSDHGRHIGMYEAEAYIGYDVYIVMDINREDYYWGKLLRSYERRDVGGTRRMHRIKVEGCNDYWLVSRSYVGTEQEFKGDNFTLFLMH